MKAIVFNKPDDYEYKDVDLPEIDDCEILVRNKYAGLCGTDIHILKGEFLSTYPLIPGHEFSGIVEKIGKKVREFAVGDHVVIDPNICCNKCVFCKINEQNFCENFGGYGVTRNGGFAQYSVIYESNLHKINDLALEEAAMIEPLSCVIYGLNKIKINYGENVIIFGAGPIGILLLQLLNLKGVGKTVVVDINPKKLKTAKEFGASEAVLNDSSLGKELKKISRYGFDILVDATGISEVCQQIFEYANINARILLYGVCKQNEFIKISPYNLFRKNLSVYSAFSYNRTMPQVISLLKSKKVNVKSLISHRLKLDEFDKALEIIKEGSYSKIIFDCS